MRGILFYVFFLLGFLSFAQTTDKGYWSSQAELEISIPKLWKNHNVRKKTNVGC